MTLTVTDDGSGFEPEPRTTASACIGMQERVELVDGRLSIGSAGRGTIVRAELPAAHGAGRQLEPRGQPPRGRLARRCAASAPRQLVDLDVDPAGGRSSSSCLSAR